jgi:5-methylcytosine-specific restriction protein A
MTHKLASACSTPGCPNTAARNGRCLAHQRPRPKTAAQYGRPWQRLRLQVLAEQPYCFCGALAREVDHIIALNRGGTNDRSNLIARCKRCHSRKTVKCEGGWG